jgi:hypothetical protein
MEDRRRFVVDFPKGSGRGWDVGMHPLKGWLRNNTAVLGFYKLDNLDATASHSHTLAAALVRTGEWSRDDDSNPKEVRLKFNQGERIIDKSSPGGLSKPITPQRIMQVNVYMRDRTIVETALKNAEYKCEIGPNCSTFISNATDKPYLEGHHLIPLSKQNEVEFKERSLDILENVVVLCPSCHRHLHHGKYSVKKMLTDLLEKKNERLIAIGIVVKLDDLYGYYPPNRIADGLLDDEASG